MSRPASVLLCCEAGAGRGHAITLATVARAVGPLHPCQAILPRLTHADVLHPVCDRVDRGPHVGRLPYMPASGTLTWASWLLTRGFADPATLQARFDWWCETLRAIRPGLVVADYAPTALMAGRALGIRSVATGAAFGLPPPRLASFPGLLTPLDAVAHGSVLGDAPPPDERAICDSINATLGPYGLPALGHLPEVYAADLSLPRGVVVWDPYAHWREHPLLLPIDRLPPLKTGKGDAVFIYLSSSELQCPAICAALRDLPFTACLVAPGLSAEQNHALSSNPRIHIAPRSLTPDDIAARSRVILCAGQAGRLALAVLAGIPVLALPVQHEQLSNALRASARLPGCRVLPHTTRSKDSILQAVSDLWSQHDIARNARDDAVWLRAQYRENALDAYRRVLTPVLHAARGRAQIT